MAEGLSTPALGPWLGQGFRSFANQWESLTQEPVLSNGGPSILGRPIEAAPDTDVLELGNSEAVTNRLIPPGGFEMSPNGTYQFSRFAASASLDLSFTQSSLQVSSEDDSTQVLSSLSELNISLRVSAEFEEALIETGRNRGGNIPQSFRAASEAVVNQFAAQQIRATLNFNLSFSQSSLSFSSTGAGLEDLSGFADDGTLSGYLTLLESFFGDDERFENFLERLESFVQGIMGGGMGAAKTEAEPVSASLPEGQSLTAQTTSLDVSIELSFESTTIQVSNGQQMESSDPIVLDLDGDGIELSSASKGVRFDLDADGRTEKMATATGGDGLLALDRNGNGVIDDGRELFGDQNGAKNGFEELARFDSNLDGAIDSRDAVFDRLRVWADSNLDGISQAGELLTLSNAGISSINLGYRDVSEAASGGNKIAQRSFFTKSDGSHGQAVDALLNRLA